MFSPIEKLSVQRGYNYRSITGDRRLDNIFQDHKQNETYEHRYLSM